VTDLTLVNANVLTMDPDPSARPRASTVAIAGGRIEALDASTGVPAGSGRVVDLRGATVLPGFHDAHNHMVGFGMSLAEVDRAPPGSAAWTSCTRRSPAGRRRRPRGTG